MPVHNNNDGGPWGDTPEDTANDSPARGGAESGPRNPNPWGEAPPRRAPGPRPTGTRDIDDLLRRGQEKLRTSFGGDGNGDNPVGDFFGGNAWLWALGAIIAVWVVATSFYRVDAQERGVVLRFGRFVGVTDPGLQFKAPWPVDTVILSKVEQINSVDIGATEGSAENLMVTGDQNIINLAYAVRWKIKNPELFLFELAEPEQTVREVGESAMRAEISKATLNDAIGPQRAQIAELVRERMQEILDSYRSGIEVRGVDIKQADPPAAVDDAFKDVSAAQQDAQQYLNQSRAYAQQLLASAQGAAAAFEAVYAQYKLAPEVTRKRMYFETMESVLSKVDKTVVETGGVQTYLPLPEVRRRAASAEPSAVDAASNSASGKSGQ
ncbi:FtsH protease activity modulator HflK [Polymorphobacter fuscus]|uniref:Protein HflK n=1 Tax=Sandarakinorhabdus fusca TaxID=1439888 RepID=A0A7C9GQA2_9SPHN|nr:FtsH protease activity modulator HflK [Polymorphobacter fuscus]KAB7644964.1 FtsH protease activity modulator HflK [Polymorphobacter fuscus]MQT18252.1 FtsH protease activity modulator HflK [Polymorphobacter fuscus]NJC09576.1 membrane protease subunit HflK [Polymorphobacter fuscus]